MAVTIQQIREVLAGEEPDYKALARGGAALLPHLRTLVASTDRRVAPKAAYLATLIDDDRTADVLNIAAQSSLPTVRIAVASGLRNLKRPAASGIISKLLNDQHAGVRKMAVKSAATRGNSVLSTQLSKMGQTDAAPHVRALAQQVVSKAQSKGKA